MAYYAAVLNIHHPQILLDPDADITTDSWVSTPLWEKVSDDQQSEPDDVATQISCPTTVGPSNTETYTCEVRLENPTIKPNFKQVHRIRVRARADIIGGGSSSTMTVSLIEGTTTIGNNGFSLGDTWTTHSFTLTSSEVNSISDYNDLRIRISCQQFADQDFDSVDSFVTWAQFEAEEFP